MYINVYIYILNVYTQVTPPAAVVDYIPDPAAVAAAYSNLNPMYSTSPYAPSPADNIYMTPAAVHHTTNFYPTVTDNLFHQYRLQGVSGYYPEYHHSAASASAAATYAVTNGFLPYDSYSLAPSQQSSTSKEDKWQADAGGGGGGGGGKYYPSAGHHHQHLHSDGSVGGRTGYSTGGYISPVTTSALPPTPASSTSSAAAAAAAAASAQVLNEQCHDLRCLSH